MKREIKPFFVTKAQIEQYEFTDKQKKAYTALVKAAKRCELSGLSLLAKQDSLLGYPSKLYLNDMLTTDYGNSILSPYLTGCDIRDSGADDMEHIKSKYIKG